MKVRPNGVPKGADLDATLRQIGRALHEVGEDAAGLRRRDPRRGPRRRRPSSCPTSPRSSSYADHPNVYVCWNSNPTDVVDGSIRENFALVAAKIREVHLRDLTDEQYPWRELFALLDAAGLHTATPSPRSPRAPTPSASSATSASLWLAYQPRPAGV